MLASMGTTLTRFARPTFPLGTAARLAGVSRDRIAVMGTRGLIHLGQRTPRAYSPQNLVELTIINAISTSGGTARVGQLIAATVVLHARRRIARREWDTPGDQSMVYSLATVGTRGAGIAGGASSVSPIFCVADDILAAIAQLRSAGAREVRVLAVDALIDDLAARLAAEEARRPSLPRAVAGLALEGA